VIIKDREELELALNLYRDTVGVSFTDCLILIQIQNFQPDDFLIFDENLKKLYNNIA
jgi:hypothetical protein